MAAEGKQIGGASALMTHLMQDGLMLLAGVIALGVFSGALALAGMGLGWAFDNPFNDPVTINGSKSWWSQDIVLVYLSYGLYVVAAVRGAKMIHFIFPAHLSGTHMWIRTAIGLVIAIANISIYWKAAHFAHSFWHHVAFWMGAGIFWFGYAAANTGEDWARHFLHLPPREKSGGHGHGH